ncbi:hypothetical protein BST61_g7949 [Cercospora zeina]
MFWSLQRHGQPNTVRASRTSHRRGNELCLAAATQQQAQQAGRQGAEEVDEVWRLEEDVHETATELQCAQRLPRPGWLRQRQSGAVVCGHARFMQRPHRAHKAGLGSRSDVQHPASTVNINIAPHLLPVVKPSPPYPQQSDNPASSPPASSIDAIVQAPVAQVVEALRPLASLRPSWIGPKAVPRPATPGAVAMTMPITLEYSSPGLQPPVYIATSLSDPQWEPIEMEGTKDNGGEYHFSKSFNAHEGEYQYKLRLGPGDWWVCDEHQPQVDDGMGNKNNLVTVKAGPPRLDSVVHDHDVPLMPHESANQPPPLSPLLQSERNAAPQTPDVQHQAPFFAHESLPPAKSDEKHEEPDHEQHSPLLPHESASPMHESVSPLFHHESTAIDDQKHGDHVDKSPLLSGRKHSGDSIPQEADPNEPGLERFPTDHRGILDSIARTQKSLAEDQTHDHSPSPSPTAKAVKASPSLPSLAEDVKEEELAEAKKKPQVALAEVDNRPAAPITPPMTPTKEKQADPIIERIPKKAQTAKDTAKATAEQAVEKVDKNDYAAILTGSMFAFAVALTAVGLWFFSEGGRTLDIVDS